MKSLAKYEATFHKTKQLCIYCQFIVVHETYLVLVYFNNPGLFIYYIVKHLFVPHSCKINATQIDIVLHNAVPFLLGTLNVRFFSQRGPEKNPFERGGQFGQD